MTETERERLAELARQLRRRAAPVGPLHAFWDVIFDIESLLAGKPTFLTMTPAEWIAYAEECLQR